MSNRVWLAAGILMGGLLGLLPQPVALHAAEPPVATVRPDRLAPFISDDGSAPVPERDPFNWSREQISLFKSQAHREASNSVAGLTLTGILWDEKKPLAVINNTIVGKGDAINDTTIQEVRRDLVIFDQAGIRYTLWLEPILTTIAPGKTKR
ncbi:MAG: hypothetical protein ACOY3Z_02375 [Thermodesulfobacteriota bacterium]